MLVAGLGKEEPVAHLGCGERGRALWLWIVVKSVALEFLVMLNQDNHCCTFLCFSDHFMPCPRLWYLSGRQYSYVSHALGFALSFHCVTRVLFRSIQMLITNWQRLAGGREAYLELSVLIPECHLISCLGVKTPCDGTGRKDSLTSLVSVAPGFPNPVLLLGAFCFLWCT